MTTNLELQPITEQPDGTYLVTWINDPVTVDWDAIYYEYAKKYGLEYLFRLKSGPAA